ncbi:hypothetical protein TNCV_5101711 [Trichonephila clavipes]|nr:hypothetical protein TNCV_5101711 [Trichonephila clavipes]
MSNTAPVPTPSKMLNVKKIECHGSAQGQGANPALDSTKTFPGKHLTYSSFNSISETVNFPKSHHEIHELLPESPLGKWQEKRKGKRSVHKIDGCCYIGEKALVQPYQFLTLPSFTSEYPDPPTHSPEDVGVN